jgi:ketosteroid isomerase-like protein
MSDDNVDVVRRCIASLNAADLAALPELVHPDIEWRDRMHAPDVPEVLHGIAALEGLAEQWQAAYDSLTVEVLEYIDEGTWVICVSRWVAQSKDSGITVDVRSVDAYEVQDGKLRRSWGGFTDLQTARSALGLLG